MSTPSLWRTPSYLTWLVGDTALGLTRALVGFAFPLIALVVTDDPAQAGAIGGVGLAVAAFSGIVGGVWADRHPRTRLLVLGALIGAVVAGGFMALALADALTFVVLLAIEVVLALRTGVFGMAGEALLKDIVPSGAIGRAQATNQARDAALNLGGGPLGGVLLTVGAWFVGAVLLACQVIALVTAWLLRRHVPGHAPVRAEARRSVFAEAREGFAWLFSRSDLRGVLAIITIINLGLSTAMTTVIFSLQQRGFSPTDIGWIAAGAGASMLAGSLLAPWCVAHVRTGILAGVGIAALAATVAALPFVDALWPTVALLAGGTFLIPALNAGMSGYFMVAVPTHLIGRASSAASLCTAGAAPLAPVLAGVGLAVFGRLPTLLCAAALCALAALLAIASRPLRALPAESGWAAHAERSAPPSVSVTRAD